MHSQVILDHAKLINVVPLLSLSSLVEVLTDTLELTLVPVTVPTRSRPESSVNLTTSNGTSGVVGFS